MADFFSPQDPLSLPTDLGYMLFQVSFQIQNPLMAGTWSSLICLFLHLTDVRITTFIFPDPGRLLGQWIHHPSKTGLE
jgi:hypothetical protein